MANEKSRARIYYANPEQNGDLLYFGNFHAPDPFFALEHRGRKIAVLSSLEYARAVRGSDFDEIIPLERVLREARQEYGENHSPESLVILGLALAKKVRAFEVSPDFPARFVLELADSGLVFKPGKIPFEPKRLIKSKEEADAIAKANRASAAALREVARILKASTIRKNRLIHKGQVLTSEFLHERIEVTCLENGAVSHHAIAAGGDQACDPHERGSGPIRPHELIVVDVFPRDKTTHYHGDMTRTFLKGRASEAQKALVDSVRTAQKEALAKVKSGVSGRSVHQTAVRSFRQRGYQTEEKGGVWRGFFHGTGHGLGLDVHELPRIGRSGQRLRTGMVFTVEPGLYYPGLGGCRIEDVVQVQPKGCQMLSSAPYRWRFS